MFSRLARNSRRAGDQIPIIGGDNVLGAGATAGLLLRLLSLPLLFFGGNVSYGTIIVSRVLGHRPTTSAQWWRRYILFPGMEDSGNTGRRMLLLLLLLLLLSYSTVRVPKMAGSGGRRHAKLVVPSERREEERK